MERPPSPPPLPDKPLEEPSIFQNETARVGFYVLDLASMVASTYHGYKRNNSVGWAIWWGFMGSIFPVITPVIAIAQGFAKPIKS